METFYAWWAGGTIFALVMMGIAAGMDYYRRQFRKPTLEDAAAGISLCFFPLINIIVCCVMISYIVFDIISVE